MIFFLPQIDKEIIPYAIPPLLSALFCCVLGFFIFFNNSKSKANLYFSLFLLVCAVWQAGFAAMNVMKNESDAFLFSRILYTAVIFIPIFYFSFIANFLSMKIPKFVFFILYFIALFFIFLLWASRLFLKGNIRFPWGYTSEAAIGHSFFLIFFFSIFIFSFFKLYHALKKESPVNTALQNRIRYVFVAFIIALIASTDFLSTYHVDYYPLGFIFMVIFSLVTSYAILKHQLMDIRVVIKRTILYTFWTLFISMAYAIMIFFIQSIMLPTDSGATLHHKLTNFLYKSSGLIAFIINLGLGLVVYMHDRKSKLNEIFCIFSLSIAGWSVGSWLANVIFDKDLALSIIRLNYAFGVFVPPLFFHFVTEFVGRRGNKLLCAGYAFSSFLLILLPTPFFIHGLRRVANYDFYMTDPGICYFLFVGFFCTYFLITFFVIFTYGHRLDDSKKRQLRYIFVAYLIGMTAGIEYFSAVFGILRRPPIDDYILIGTFIVLSYSILKHGLLDIRIVVKKTLFYSCLALSISSFYVLIVFLVYRFLVGSDMPAQYLFNNLLIILLITLFLRPLEQIFQRMLDKRFFRGTIEEISHQKSFLESELERRERLKSVRILAAGMAHEIKNPLTSIKTFAEYLPKKYDDPEFREKFSRLVIDEVDRVNNIVRQLLEFSKPSEPELRAVLIPELLDETLALLNSNMLRRDIVLIKDFDRYSMIMADRNQLKQAMLNLFLNAIQSISDKGRLEVSARTEPDGWVKISIIDTGCGMTKDQLQHVFDPFYTTKEDGTGLGLAIVHSIITKHGGKISMESELAKGTTVNVLLKSQS